MSSTPEIGLQRSAFSRQLNFNRSFNNDCRRFDGDRGEIAAHEERKNWLTIKVRQIRLYEPIIERLRFEYFAGLPHARLALSLHFVRDPIEPGIDALPCLAGEREGFQARIERFDS